MSDSFATLWTVARQVPPSMGFSRQEYWSGLPFLSPEDLPDPGIEPESPALAGRFFTTEPLRKSFSSAPQEIPPPVWSAVSSSINQNILLGDLGGSLQAS